MNATSSEYGFHAYVGDAIWREEIRSHSLDRFSHHPLLFWLSAALPDVNLLPKGTLVK